MTPAATLRTVLATGSLATPIKQGVVSSPRVRLDFVDVDPVHVHDAFFDARCDFFCTWSVCGVTIGGG